MNPYIQSVVEFREALDEFFAKWPQIASSMVDRINDNFQILNKVSLS
ncbi:Putative IS630 family transposase domain protein [Candidatus Bealeia paramacronuclearis]|uniref:IS630 family transposase domain protein n=1 Tax=Candidatus Bealeia paramacronuclearis TaxID=1921001 RepID=A0ABZ2C7B3_9PROT|nr:putative IS630 family transposase domain protein [Candidatus Bealeia paramacronuclearis]